MTVGGATYTPVSEPRTTLGKAEAIDAMQHFLTTRRQDPAGEQVLSVEWGEFMGRDCWLVNTALALKPGEPDWFRIYDLDMTYFIDAVSGRCLAMQDVRSTTILPDDQATRPPPPTDHDEP